MEYEIPNPTYGQLEQNLSQQIQVLYLNHLGHEPTIVSCQLIDKTLTIVVENPITQLEQFLAASGKQALAEELRVNIQKAFQPLLKALIEEVLGTSVLDLLGKSNFETDRTSLIAILAATPKLGNRS